MIYQPNKSTASFGNSFSKVNPDHYLCTVDGEYYKRPVVDYQIGRYRISTGCIVQPRIYLWISDSVECFEGQNSYKLDLFYLKI